MSSPGLALLSHLARFSSQVPPHSVKRPESLELGTGHPWLESPPVIPGLGPLLETPSRHWLALQSWPWESGREEGSWDHKPVKTHLLLPLNKQCQCSESPNLSSCRFLIHSALLMSLTIVI